LLQGFLRRSWGEKLSTRSRLHALREPFQGEMCSLRPAPTLDAILFFDAFDHFQVLDLVHLQAANSAFGANEFLRKKLEIYWSEHLSLSRERPELLLRTALSTSLNKANDFCSAGFEVTKRLCNALRESHSVAEKHVAQGGRVARVLVGRFHVARLPGPEELMGGAAFCLGIVGPGGSKGELRISLGLQKDGDGFYISAHHSRAATLRRIGGWRMTTEHILVDITSVSLNMDLQCREVAVPVDGQTYTATGGTVSSLSSSAWEDSKETQELLCVLCIRELQPIPGEYPSSPDFSLIRGC